MNRWTLRMLLPVVLAGLHAVAFGQPLPESSRGQLLYSTHCISCHSTQVHWRDGKAAADWSSLKAQVRRWQLNTGLGWTEADIKEVARHLNETIYRYPLTGQVHGKVGDALRR